MDLNLQNKRALVCGASQGIGAAVAHELATLGCSVTLLARNQDKLKSVLKSLPNPERHDVAVVDLSKSTEIEKGLKEVLKKGPIQILICNAGGPASGAITDAKAEDFVNAFQSHVVANQTLVQHLLSGMKESGYGRIINIISTSVKAPIPGLGVSNTIRAAVANWAKTLSLEVGKFGITVNNVLPGFTATERLDVLKQSATKKFGKTEKEVEQMWLDCIPLNRFAKPEEVAYAVAFLASPSAAYINGINVPVDGGRTSSL